MIYGLTLWQPWAWAIAKGYKKVENRPWTLSQNLLREKPWFALHAGKKYDLEGERFLRERGLMWEKNDVVHSAVLGVFQVKEIVKQSDDPMFFGPYGWVIENLRTFEPIPARGMQGLFHFPQEIERWISDLSGVPWGRLTMQRDFF